MQSITLLFISLAEIFSKTHHLSSTLELVGTWGKLEVDVFDHVLALVAPVSYNATTDKLFTAALLPLLIIAGIFPYLLHSIEAALSRLELENRVDDESATKLVVHSRSLEAVHDLHPLLRHVNEVVDIKELRSLANLFETGVAESLLYNNVDQALMD